MCRGPFQVGAVDPISLALNLYKADYLKKNRVILEKTLGWYFTFIRLFCVSV